MLITIHIAAFLLSNIFFIYAMNLVIHCTHMQARVHAFAHAYIRTLSPCLFLFFSLPLSLSSVPPSLFRSIPPPSFFLPLSPSPSPPSPPFSFSLDARCASAIPLRVSHPANSCCSFDSDSSSPFRTRVRPQISPDQPREKEQIVFALWTPLDKPLDGVLAFK